MPDAVPSKRPGGALAKRPLHLIFLLDVSGSMLYGGKIEALNNAMREVIPAVREAAERNVGARVLVRVITFADTACWHVEQPVEIAEFVWSDVTAGGETSMGDALKLAAKALTTPPMEPRSLPPVLVLVSDGRPTDGFTEGFEDLIAQPWGERAVRVAIAIGQDADRRYLRRFIANPELKVLQAYNPEALARRFQWASSVAIDRASVVIDKAAGPWKDPESEEDSGLVVW